MPGAMWPGQTSSLLDAESEWLKRLLYVSLTSENTSEFGPVTAKSLRTRRGRVDVQHEDITVGFNRRFDLSTRELIAMT
jgi:hypothetical protein